MMTKLIDFDKMFVGFASKKLTGLDENSDLDSKLNEATKEWLGKKADWLDGKTPDEYFQDMSPDELVTLMVKYLTENLNVPEPLYRSIERRTECHDALVQAASDKSLSDAARETAFTLISGKGNDVINLCVELILYGGGLREAAVDRLKLIGFPSANMLMEKFANADSESQDAIMDVLSEMPVDGVADMIAKKLLNAHDKRALYANYAVKLGDPALIEPLETLSKLTDISYLDYLEVANAIESLGGEADRDRQFYGDPDYEAMRNYSD